MGAVYRVRDLDSGRKRFAREATIPSETIHPARPARRPNLA